MSSIEGQRDSLSDVIHRLGIAEIEYMIVGSVALYLYGLDRYTSDTDIVVDLSERQNFLLIIIKKQERSTVPLPMSVM